MNLRIWFTISLLSALPVWSQVNGTTTTSSDKDVNTNIDDARMSTPPPVSGEAYPTTLESEKRSNYLNAGLTFNAAYSDNALGGISGKPVSDVTYSVWPTIELDQTTPRWKSVLSYAPGFTFYQHTNGHYESHNAGIDVQYRVTEHVTATVHDSFQKTSDVFNQPAVSSGAVYGSAPPPTTVVLPPFANELTNTANLELTYQFSASDMVGASGTFVNLHYPNQAEVPGLYGSSSQGGSAFYNHRLSKRHYLGAQYQYSRILAFPTGVQSETQTQTVFLFYTVYLEPTLSVSFSGGPQHYLATGALSPSSSWSPAASASLGWQRRRTSFAASYARIITGGGGLTGTFRSNSAMASGRWQIARTWSVGFTGNYAIVNNTLILSNANVGGHTILGTASLRHPIGQYFDAEVGYTRIHQSFSDIAVLSTAPDINREYLAISYRFTRPLGR